MKGTKIYGRKSTRFPDSNEWNFYEDLDWAVQVFGKNTEIFEAEILENKGVFCLKAVKVDSKPSKESYHE